MNTDDIKWSHRRSPSVCENAKSTLQNSKESCLSMLNVSATTREQVRHSTSLLPHPCTTSNALIAETETIQTGASGRDTQAGMRCTQSVLFHFASILHLMLVDEGWNKWLKGDETGQSRASCTETEDGTTCLQIVWFHSASILHCKLANRNISTQ